MVITVWMSQIISHKSVAVSYIHFNFSIFPFMSLSLKKQNFNKREHHKRNMSYVTWKKLFLILCEPLFEDAQITFPAQRLPAERQGAADNIMSSTTIISGPRGWKHQEDQKRKNVELESGEAPRWCIPWTGTRGGQKEQEKGLVTPGSALVSRVFPAGGCKGCVSAPWSPARRQARQAVLPSDNASVREARDQHPRPAATLNSSSDWPCSPHHLADWLFLEARKRSDDETIFLQLLEIFFPFF